MLKMYYLQKEKHCLEKANSENNPRRAGAKMISGKTDVIIYLPKLPNNLSL